MPPAGGSFRMPHRISEFVEALQDDFQRRRGQQSRHEGQPILVPRQRHAKHSARTNARPSLRWELGRGSTRYNAIGNPEVEMAHVGVRLAAVGG
jgi:hypothetical protein